MEVVVSDYEWARIGEYEAESPEYQEAVQCDCCQEYFSADQMDVEFCPDCGGSLLGVEKQLED